MTKAYLTRDEAGGTILQDAISLFAQRAQVREGLRVQVNNLARPVKERKQLYADLRAKEDELTERIAQVLPHLEPDDQRQLLEKYEPSTVSA